MEMNQESANQLSAPDFPPGHAVQPMLAIEHSINPPVDLARDFYEDGTLEMAMLTSSSTKSLLVAANRESFESMDLDELQQFYDGNAVSGVTSEQHGIPKVANGTVVRHQDPDPCLGSVAEQLPHQSIEAASELFTRSALQDYAATESVFGRVEVGFNVHHSMGDWSSRLLPVENRFDSWSSLGAAASSQSNGLGENSFDHPDSNSVGSSTLPTRQQTWAPVELSTQSTTVGQTAGNVYAATVSQSIPDGSSINATEAGQQESAPFYPEQQQQAQQRNLYPSGSVTNLACTLELLAPKMTRTPQILCQYGFDAEAGDASECSVSQVLDSQRNSTDEASVETAESNQISEISQMQTLKLEETLNVATPAPPIVFNDDEEEDPLDSFFSPESNSSTEMSLDDGDIENKAQRIRDIICLRRGIRPKFLTKSHVLIHEVVHIILLRDLAGCPDLKNILSFCTEGGFENREVSRNFMVRDTNAMGQVWKRLKGNKKGDYDTFARAMRTCREKKKDYFDYLDSGKGSRKRIYKLGSRSLDEIAELSKILQRFVQP